MLLFFSAVHSHLSRFIFSLLFFFNDTATTEIYTLSLHDALPIFALHAVGDTVTILAVTSAEVPQRDGEVARIDRKSTRLNSSHVKISYAVFCLKKKKKKNNKQNNDKETYTIRIKIVAHKSD